MTSRPTDDITSRKPDAQIAAEDRAGCGVDGDGQADALHQRVPLLLCAGLQPSRRRRNVRQPRASAWGLLQWHRIESRRDGAISRHPNT
jgi:hypothetical protein